MEHHVYNYIKFMLYNVKKEVELIPHDYKKSEILSLLQKNQKKREINLETKISLCLHKTTHFRTEFAYN